MYESFRSHCLLDYPKYEMIFGVSEADDPAVELVRRLQVEFPQRAIHLVVCTMNLGANRKGQQFGSDAVEGALRSFNCQ